MSNCLENEKRSLIYSYYLLEDQLKEIVQFVEPEKENFLTYSHKIRSSLILACTEFEANCKSMMKEKNFELKDPKIDDYLDFLDKNYCIRQYVVRCHFMEGKEFAPFKELDEKKQKNKSVVWYQAYNKVKHDRVNSFEQANLNNMLNAITAVFITLYSRFDLDALNRYHIIRMWEEDPEGYAYTMHSIFKIKRLA